MSSFRNYASDSAPVVNFLASKPIGSSSGGGGSTGPTGPRGFTGPAGSLPSGATGGEYLFYNTNGSTWAVGPIGPSYDSVIIGNTNAVTSTAVLATSVGAFAGGSAESSTCLGAYAGQFQQGPQTVAVGDSAGSGNQGTGAVAIGLNAGSNTQGNYGVAIGYQSGLFSQGNNAVSIGKQSGFQNQGTGSIAIGYQAGNSNLPANTIVMNASSSTALNPSTAGFFVNPVTASSSTTNLLCYNTGTKEITYNNTAKTFVVNHPLDPEHKYLVHSCLEGPEAGVYYRGIGKIEKNITTVTLPSYVVDSFVSDYTVHVTPIIEEEDVNEDDISEIPQLMTSRIKNGSFKVISNVPCSFNWIVYAKRLDINVEPKKDQTVVNGNGPYLYVS